MKTSTDAARVELHAIDHAYGEAPVLHGVDLSVEPGGSLALLGPSGCGKTTLLRIIAGLERPTRGEVSIGDRVVTAPGTWVPPEQRRVGMVFQDWALFPHMSVAANVGYGLPRSERNGTRVSEALEMVGLADLGDRAPATLSGGQQQRIALARALAPRPGVLLLDEPFSNLDTALRVQVRTEVHRLLHDLGITAVFVTHDQEEAFVLGHKVAVMREGRLVQVGAPHDLYETPADRGIAEFIGSGSILPADISGGRASCAIGTVPVDAADGEAEVLLRPEQLMIRPGGNAGTVELIEYYGHDAMIFVQVNGERVQVRSGARVGVAHGDAVDVDFVGDVAVAFPASS